MEGCALLFEEGGDESSMIGSLGTKHCEVRESWAKDLKQTTFPSTHTIQSMMCIEMNGSFEVENCFKNAHE